MRVIRNDFPDFDRGIREMDRLIRNLPDLIGNLAVNFFDDNFDRQGFVDGTLTKWKPRTHNKKDIGAAANAKRRGGSYSAKTLVQSGTLRRSIQYEIKKVGRQTLITIFSDVPYAEIHNEGGEVNYTATIRQHRRKQPSRNTGRGKNKVASGITIVKQHTRTVKYTMPKRQFMGDSAGLTKRIERHIDKAFKQITGI